MKTLEINKPLEKSTIKRGEITLETYDWHEALVRVELSFIIHPGDAEDFKEQLEELINSFAT